MQRDMATVQTVLQRKRKSFNISESSSRFVETMTLSFDEFKQILATELSQIRSIARRNFIEARLVSPYQTKLEWEYGSNELFDAWTFAAMGERDVVVQFCRGGFGAMGSPWGINFRTAGNFGMDPGWYPTLDALLEDWGIQE